MFQQPAYQKQSHPPQSPKENTQLSLLFNYFDTDLDGQISYDSFKQLINILNMNIVDIIKKDSYQLLDVTDYIKQQPGPTVKAGILKEKMCEHLDKGTVDFLFDDAIKNSASIDINVFMKDVSDLISK